MYIYRREEVITKLIDLVLTLVNQSLLNQEEDVHGEALADRAIERGGHAESRVRGSVERLRHA